MSRTFHQQEGNASTRDGRTNYGDPAAMENPKKPGGTSTEIETRVTSGRPRRSPSVAEQIRANEKAKANISPGKAGSSPKRRVPPGAREPSAPAPAPARVPNPRNSVLSYQPKFGCDITDAVGIVKVRNGKGRGDLYAVVHTSGGIVRIRSTAGKEFQVERSYMKERTRMLAGNYFRTGNYS